MAQPTGPARLRAALELLRGEPELLMALAGHGRCRTCGALVPSKGEAQHALFHQALAVVASEACGSEAS